jgi:uncharacterized protein YkwD
MTEVDMFLRMLLIGLTTTFLAMGSAQACTKPANAAALGAEMIQWINQQRQAKGLGRLESSSKLAAAAQGHACDMAVRGYFEHQRPGGGPKLGARVEAKGYRFSTIAENIAKTGAADVARTAKLWRNSSGHWANILKPNVAEIGMGLATRDGQVYWVMNVGRQR